MRLFSARETALLRDLACDLTYDERRQLAHDPSPLAQRIRDALGPPPLDPHHR